MKLITRVALFSSLVIPAYAQSDAQWIRFTGPNGTAVEYPSAIFSGRAVGDDVPPGAAFATPDGRARLYVFVVPNDRHESPAQYLIRVFPQGRRQLDYDRVTARFFAISEVKGDLILYRRCNFPDRKIHCIELSYPRREKKAWDYAVTRISLSLRPR